MKTHFLFTTLCLGVWFSNKGLRVEAQPPPPPPPPPLPYRSPCNDDKQCEPYSVLKEQQVKCDKARPSDLSGFCGCEGDWYRITNQNLLALALSGTAPPVLHIDPNPAIGYDEKFYNTAIDKGCKKKHWPGKICPIGSDCDQHEIASSFSPHRGDYVLCRRVSSDTESSSGKGEFRCVGRERRSRTYGECRSPTQECGIKNSHGINTLIKPFVDCSKFLHGNCTKLEKANPFTSTKNADPKACLYDNPAIPTLAGHEPDMDYYCHHHSDCQDPHAVCLPCNGYHENFTSIYFGLESFPRYFCVCDQQNGYIFSFVNGEPVCTLRSEINEICLSVEDCGLDKGMDCAQFGTTDFKTCQCVVDPVFKLEYFEGSSKDVAQCFVVAEFYTQCVADAIKNRNFDYVDNCRRRNDNFELTGLICPKDAAIPYCECNQASAWDATNGKCVRMYVDLDEVCGIGTGLLQCNPWSHLACEAVPGTFEHRCVCDTFSDPDRDGFKYCRRRVQIVGYGGPCDEVTDFCNDALNVICRNEICECMTDEKITDTGTECRETVERPKGVTGPTSKAPAVLQASPVFLILARIFRIQ